MTKSSRAKREATRAANYKGQGALVLEERALNDSIGKKSGIGNGMGCDIMQKSLSEFRFRRQRALDNSSTKISKAEIRAMNTAELYSYLKVLFRDGAHASYEAKLVQLLLSDGVMESVEVSGHAPQPTKTNNNFI